MNALRILFMGTADFAVPALERLTRDGYAPVAVVTGPDKPSGRGQQMHPTPVKRIAMGHGFPLLQPEKLRDPSFAEAVRSFSPDVIVVVAYRILPPEIFTLARLGALNLHASLLPRYRGAAPINRAIMNGETETGVTTFLLDAQVDTGSILLQERVAIGPDEDAGSLHDRLAEIGARVTVDTVRLLEQGKALPRAQDATCASPAPKIFKEDCRIVWNGPAESIRNQIRGLSPSPAAFTILRDKVLKITRAHIVQGTLSPGTVVAEKGTLLVGTADHVLSVEVLQQEGRKKMDVKDFLRGYRLTGKEHFD
ncbi:MAG TPA: methionyl-tRNA formyltransferase [Bacteroidota bacterium]|nr:methionyl-tRNA formyltransferase [Bacteroidota bacterium]